MPAIADTLLGTMPCNMYAFSGNSTTPYIAAISCAFIGGTVAEQLGSIAEEDEQGRAGREAVHALLVHPRRGPGP